MSSEPVPGTEHLADALSAILRRTVLQQRPSSIPGREIVQVITEIPPGVESGWHIHPGEEVGYIVAAASSSTPLENTSRSPRLCSCRGR